ncbi:MAG: GNAT family N-acetyltransferase [Deltaproteobacteria bacterium]|nr:GNAT family N-acetyltransferase [Deltaproteobacteria bacterium]
MRLEVIDELARLESVRDAWNQLVATTERGSLFGAPDWLLAWWHSYRQVLGAELFVLAGWGEDDELLMLAPFYRREARSGPGIKIREIRLLGDAGPRPPSLDILVTPGLEDQAGVLIAQHLRSCEAEWDVIDLEPLHEPSRVRAYAVNRLAGAGYHVLSAETGGARRIALDIPGLFPDDAKPDPEATEYTSDESLVRKGLTVLRSLSRLEWADREENSPLADAEANQLLVEVATKMAPTGKARVSRIETADGAAVAAALVIDDGPRAVVVAMGVDPESGQRSAAKRLVLAQARSAAERGCVGMDLVIGANDYELPPLPHSRQRAMRVSVYSHSKSAGLSRTYGAVRRRVEAARTAPGAAAAGARAAWSKIRSAAANVAEREKMHLYRGELWTRGVEPTLGLDLELLTEEQFDAMGENDRRELVELLELDVDYCRAKWRRGDMVVFATVEERPAGIGWCARKGFDVPELGRRIRIGRHEAYIYDLFVSPSARGRAVAPSMLEFMAHELRQQDVYRSWALIGADNSASIRAFEKAAYTAVADVIYTRVGAMDRLTLRPPDPEAEQLLGLS